MILFDYSNSIKQIPIYQHPFKIYQSCIIICGDMLHHSVTIQFQKPIMKIICFACAYDNTYVFTSVIIPGGEESIIHIDANGKCLFEHRYQNNINFFQMPNDREVIVIDVANNHIDIINLQTQSIRSIDHQYRYDDVAQAKIQFFEASKYIAIIERGTFNDPRLRVTYYNYADTSKPQLCRSIYQYSSYQGDWNYECQIKKGNNHSMIVWYKYKHEKFIKISYLDLRDFNNKEFKVLQFKNTGGQSYGIDNFYLNLSNVWEIKKDKFMIIGNTPKQSVHHNKEGVVNNNYTYDSAKDILKETQFYFLDENKYRWNENLIEIMNLGNVSIFHTFKYEEGRTCKSPVYFIDNENEEIVSIQSWQATCLINFFIPGYISDTIVEAKYQNGDVREVTVTVKKINIADWRVNKVRKQTHLLFMLHINEQFDDDLLKDAIELIHQ